MSNLCSDTCSDIRYEFSAVVCPPDAVALYVTVRGVPYDLTPPHIQQVWQDVQVCFTHAGHPRVAAMLGRLPHDWNGAGTFVIQGPPTQRQEVFDLLSRDFSHTYKPGRPHTVSLEFHQSRTPPHIQQVWQDVQVCFTHAGHPRVAAMLGRLPHDWNGAGTFVIQGPPTQRQEVFDLLSRDFSHTYKPGRPHTVSLEFHQSRTPPHLVIHAHYGMVYSWRVDHAPPSPIIQIWAEAGEGAKEGERMKEDIIIF